MAFKDFPEQNQSIALLQRALQHGRLAHAYLFTGHHLEDLEALARVLAKAINCQQPLNGATFHTDSCDRCASCGRIDHDTHPDVHWIRPESKSRIITVEQMRNLMIEIQLKPGEADYKVAVIVAADRLRVEAANAFLKTLEEPPAKSILILLSTEPQRVLETILSRCLRLNFTGGRSRPLDPAQHKWLADFSQMASAEQKSLLVRYRLLDVLLERLNQTKARIEESLTSRSPLQQYKDADKNYIEKWEAELAAAIEAEYRRQRTDILKLLQEWLRDIWLRKVLSGPGERHRSLNEDPATAARSTELRSFAELPGIEQVAQRISNEDAMQNLQTLEQLQLWLGTNVQEALALEVGLLKLKL